MGILRRMMRIGVLTFLALMVVPGCSKKEAADVTPTAKSPPAPLPPIKQPDQPPRGAAKEPDNSYRLTVSPPEAAKIGAPAVARVSVTPAPGWKINKDFPTALQISAPDGVTLSKPSFEVGDAAKLDDHELTFEVKLTPARSGTHKVGGEIKFAVCTADTCDPKKQPIAFDVTVQ